MFGAKSDVESSSTEKYREDLVEGKSLSRDIDKNSSSIEKSSKDMFLEQSLSKAELEIGTKTSLIEKLCGLLKIKKEDQNIKQTHRV